uniref:Peptidase M20 dimerisation domain-containing protein n=1 Tax=Brassica campestris TaxID=3711 RepID=M4F700_BRACM
MFHFLRFIKLALINQYNDLTHCHTRQTLDLTDFLLNSHVDVVPFEAEKWDHPPLGAEIDEDGRIYARGTQDMKSVGMQYLEAIRKLVASGYKPLRSVYVTFVPDEEIGGADGVGRFVESRKYSRA